MAENIKPKFDPSKPFTVVHNEINKPKFDPGKPVDNADFDVTPPPVSKKESFVRGGAQGLTLGTADEITGALEATGNKLSGDEQEFLDLYRKHRDESRAKYKAAEEANPMTYLGGNVVGTLPLAAIPGGASVTGAALAGGAAGLGTSNADLTKGEYGQAGADTLIGGALGAGVATVPAAFKAVAGSTPVQAFIRGAEGTNLVGKGARQAIGNEVIDFAGQTGANIQQKLTDEAINKAKMLEEASKSGKTIDISRIINSLPEEMEKLPTSYTTEGDAARAALKQPFERAMAKGAAPIDTITTPEQMAHLAENQTRLSPKELDSFRRALGNLGYEKELRDDQVTALAKRLSGVTGEKLYTEEPLVGKSSAKIKDLIDAQEIFNLGGKGADELGNEKALTPLLQRLESDSVSSDIARSQFEKGLGALKRAEPEFGSNVEKTGKELAEKYDLVRDINKPITISREGAKRAAILGGNLVGTGISKVDKALGGVPGAITKNVVAPALKNAEPAISQSGISSQINMAKDINNADTSKLSKNLYKLNNDELRTISARLQEDPSLKNVSESLQNAIDQGDEAKKNAALFSIMQNPKARHILHGKDE